MTGLRLIRRSLIHHARLHFGTLLGTMIAAAVLVGALVVGDSVRASLRSLALLRLGRIESALATGDRLFRSDFFGAGTGYVAFVQPHPGQPGQPVLAAPVLQLPAVAVAGDGTARANQVVVQGVDARFWRLAEARVERGEIPPDRVLLNEPAARQLKVRAGDDVLLRVQKPSALSRDAPLTTEEDATVALRLKVGGIVRDEELGRFSLAANQVAPLNAFVSLAELQRRLETLGRANLLIAGTPTPSAPSVPFVTSGIVSTTVLTNVTDTLNLGVRRRWRLEDAELELRLTPGNRAVDLRTRRVFLDPPLPEQVTAILSGTNAARMAPRTTAAGILTYFVNELRAGERATPYSMVTAAAPSLLPAALADDEILISPWLADDLQAAPGDRVTLKYYVMGTRRDLVEHSATFRIKGLFDLNSPGVDRTLMPDFPGMTDAANCRDWDTGLPIQNDRIRPKDEEYWRQYRGTPKAFVTLAAGQRLWGNRFGDLTALRFQTTPPAAGPAAAAAAPGAVRPVVYPIAIGNLSTLLTQGLDPALFGMRFRPVRAEALAASEQSQDFGQLFLGFSFFLITSALLLVALLFQFGVETRTTEVGTLLALGFRPAQVRRLLLQEGAVLALGGALLGAQGGVWYARGMLHGLSTVWSDAVGGARLTYHLEPGTVAAGVLAATLVTTLAMGLALRRQAAQAPRALMASGAELETLLESGGVPSHPARGGTARWQIPAAVAGAAAALGLASWGWLRGDTASAGLFFGAGALLLVSGLSACSGQLARLATRSGGARLTRASLALRAATRRRRRSLTVIGLLASGSFLIVAIGIFRLDAVPGADRRSAGTGGFALLGQSTQPVLHDLNSVAGRETSGLDPQRLAGVGVVPFRVRDGDDASCLNLNRAQSPRILGVAPELLAQRGAFTFAQAAKGLTRSDGWKLLTAGKSPIVSAPDQPAIPSQAAPETTNAAGGGAPPAVTGPDDLVPAIGDQASILWALGKKVGDTIPMTDERGRPFRLKLVGAVANSILQGNLVIAEDEFVRRFPGVAGYRMFLVDAPTNRVEEVASELTRGLQDLGLELTPARERLAAFNAVQNTYLGTFQVLGGLGLLLGSFGLGVVVLRNVLERRGEYAVLVAVGWERRSLRRMILVEHGALLAAGLAVGVAAAAVAVLPSALGPGTEVPYRTLALTLGGVLANGALWTWLATLAAMRGDVLDALRNS